MYLDIITPTEIIPSDNIIYPTEMSMKSPSYDSNVPSSGRKSSNTLTSDAIDEVLNSRIELLNAPPALTCGSCATKNIRYRKSMEDYCTKILDFLSCKGDGYFAVFDGHAGSLAAQWCSLNLHILFARNLNKYSSLWQISAIMAATFDQADRLLTQLPNYDGSGCTASVAYVHNGNAGHSEELLSPAHDRSSPPPPSPRYLYTANVGDSRIVICNNGNAERLTKDHRGDDLNECERIIRSGGSMRHQRVNGVLAVTRALGDSKFKDYVSGKPYTTETLLDPDTDEFIIIACDGLWDVCGDQKAVELIRYIADPQLASRALLRYALQSGSTDNITCSVVRFRPPPASDITAFPSSANALVSGEQLMPKRSSNPITIPYRSSSTLKLGLNLDTSSHDQHSQQHQPRPQSSSESGGSYTRSFDAFYSPESPAMNLDSLIAALPSLNTLPLSPTDSDFSNFNEDANEYAGDLDELSPSIPISNNYYRPYQKGYRYGVKRTEVALVFDDDDSDNDCAIDEV